MCLHGAFTCQIEQNSLFHQHIPQTIDAFSFIILIPRNLIFVFFVGFVINELSMIIILVIFKRKVLCAWKKFSPA